jgi:hypothetical protein
VGTPVTCGHQALRIVTRVEALVGGVLRQGHAAALVGFALEDGAHERFQIELLVGQKLRGGAQELLIAGRIRDTEIINRLDQAGPKEILPDAIDDGAAEIRVVARGEPVGESFAAVRRIIEGKGVAVQGLGLLRATGERLVDVTLVGREDDFLAVAAATL